MQRVAVYTAIFGGYDSLRDQLAMSGVDMVCFTDDPHLRSEQWDVRLSKPRAGHPRMAAKWYKMHPNRALPHHEVTIWIDGGVQIQREDFAQIVVDALGPDGMSMMRHPVRSRVADEAEVCVDLPKYAGLPLLEQVANYRRLGFPDESGLWAGGVIGRDSRRVLRRLGRRWWRENVRWTYQDQVSLPYLLWRLDVHPGEIPYGLWDGQLLTMVAHASDL